MSHSEAISKLGLLRLVSPRGLLPPEESFHLAIEAELRSLASGSRGPRADYIWSRDVRGYVRLSSADEIIVYRPLTKDFEPDDFVRVEMVWDGKLRSVGPGVLADGVTGAPGMQDQLRQHIISI